LERLKVSYTMAVRAGTKAIAQVIATIADEDWVAIDYLEGGEPAVAETTYKGRHLVVRRTRLVGPQATLWPDWRHFASPICLAPPSPSTLSSASTPRQSSTSSI